MNFNKEEMSEDEIKLIEEVENMLVPELMAMIEVGEEQVKDTQDYLIKCEDDDVDKAISDMIGALLTLRYYKQVLNKRDVDNMTVGELKNEYELFTEKMEKLSKEKKDD